MSQQHDETKEIARAFNDAVNMTPKQLATWLERDESQEVGQKQGNDESTGHRSGRRIGTILEKKHSDYTADDLAHMRKVVGYIHRHLAQRPDGDVAETPWRYSLMNWGHDPVKQ